MFSSIYTLANKLFIKKYYFLREMSEGSSIESHQKEMKELMDKLSSIHLRRRPGCHVLFLEACF